MVGTGDSSWIYGGVQANFDIRVFQETKVRDGIYPRMSAGY